ncbi:MAG TPA: Fe2+-dependent dioxygenase [Alphaproteobacteria bacterium]|nr:Fe2+-dependent dioxygenase [Alphaproteobacteria bacterium]
MLIEIPEVLPPADAERLCERLRCANFIDGRATAGNLAESIKRNRELPVTEEWLAFGKEICAALTANSLFNNFALPRRLMLPIFSRYDKGMAYGAHSDEAILGIEKPAQAVRNDLAMTLFLSPPSSYDGGELSVETPVGPHAFKLPAGHAVVYPSHYLHEVRRVTRGTRLAAVTWIQSFVRDAERRAVLYELGCASTKLRGEGAAHAEVNAINNVYHKLLRMWGMD